MTIRVLIADDQDMVRAGFRMIVESTEDMEVAGEVDNGEDAVAKAVELRPDVCLFDVRMPRLNGVEATRQVVERCGPEGPRVVIVTTFDLDEYVFGAFHAGATGFLLKNSGPELLVEAIRSAQADESLISPKVTTRLLRQMTRSTTAALGQLDDRQLNEREEQIVRAVAIGSTNTEIADQLHLSVSSVKANVTSLLNKVKVRNRVELAMWAYRTGRVD